MEKTGGTGMEGNRESRVDTFMLTTVRHPRGATNWRLLLSPMPQAGLERGHQALRAEGLLTTTPGLSLEVSLWDMGVHAWPPLTGSDTLGKLVLFSKPQFLSWEINLAVTHYRFTGS